MRKTLYLLLLIAGYSCNSTGKPAPVIAGDSTEQIDLNGLKIEQQCVREISKVSGKAIEKNTVVRYKMSESNKNMFESYDSIVSGIKFSFIDEQLAFEIIEAYFDQVKASGNYLYLTNLDFDESYNVYYDIVIAPVPNQLELIRFVGVEPVNYGLTVDEVVDWFRKKQSEFNFQIVVADMDRIEAFIKSEPASYTGLANEIYAFCPDVIDQGHSDIDELIAFLKSEKRMWFWWD